MVLLAQFVIYFTIYSFLGWVCECIYCSLGAKKLINRGFLAGPYCPIYGFGSLLVILLLEPLGRNPFVIFFGGMVLTSILEYFTSFLMEKIFHMKWWDYSTYPYNINGRVCLLNSTLFGLLSLFLMFVVNPPIARFVVSIEPIHMIVAATICGCVFLADTIISVRTTLQISGKMQKIDAALNELKEKNQIAFTQMKQKVETRFEEYFAGELAEINEESNRRIAELKKSLQELGKNQALHRRLMDAFPTMYSKEFESGMQYFKNAIKEKRQTKQNNKKQKKA